MGIPPPRFPHGGPIAPSCYQLDRRTCRTQNGGLGVLA